MIRFSARLALAGGREALTRLVIIAVAVALGTGMLLMTLAAINGVNTQNSRYAWLNTGRTSSTRVVDPSVDPLWWRITGDYYDGETIGRIDVAATGPTSPKPPGVERLPGPGEFVASPAMTKLLDRVPAAQLADRFPGHRVGTIGPAALPGPDSLVVIVGRTPDEMAHLTDAKQVWRIASTLPSQCDGCDIGIRSSGLDLILGVTAAALLFPVLIFIGAATRLAAARREQRFAAMRLIGATPAQISVVAAVESVLAAVVGTGLGFAVFYALRDPVAAINLTGYAFYPSDLSLNLADILGVLVGIPVGAALAGLVALRRVRISPLGVTRRVTPKPPRVYRLIPLALGIAELTFAIGHVPHSSIQQVAVFLPGFLVIMAGLIIAGPWFTMIGARLLARRSSRPATLVAARRLADNPHAAFRAVSGLVLGLFVTTVATGVITTIVDHRGTQHAGLPRTMVQQPWPMNTTETSVDPNLLTTLRSEPGVTGVVVVRTNPAWRPITIRQVGAGAPVDLVLPGLASCADLAADPDLGRCPPGARVVEVQTDFMGPEVNSPANVWPVAPATTPPLGTLPLAGLAVNTDGSTAAIERVRTVLETGLGAQVPPATQDDFATDQTQTLAGWQQLANVVILASLPIAGCSLAVSIVGGLTERKRPFSLLRLTGVRIRTLRGVVALESAVPLLAVAVIAIGAALLGSQLFLRAQMGYTLSALHGEYYIVVFAGLAASLAIIGLTLPLLERITGPETARSE